MSPHLRIAWHQPIRRRINTPWPFICSTPLSSLPAWQHWGWGWISCYLEGVHEMGGDHALFCLDYVLWCRNKGCLMWIVFSCTSIGWVWAMKCKLVQTCVCTLFLYCIYMCKQRSNDILQVLSDFVSGRQIPTQLNGNKLPTHIINLKDFNINDSHTKTPADIKRHKLSNEII